VSLGGGGRTPIPKKTPTTCAGRGRGMLLHTRCMRWTGLINSRWGLGGEGRSYCVAFRSGRDPGSRTQRRRSQRESLTAPGHAREGVRSRRDLPCGGGGERRHRRCQWARAITQRLRSRAPHGPRRVDEAGGEGGEGRWRRGAASHPAGEFNCKLQIGANNSAMEEGVPLSNVELDAMGLGRSQHFRAGASKAKTAARKAAKVRPPRPPFPLCLHLPSTLHVHSPIEARRHPHLRRFPLRGLPPPLSSSALN
jgi:hypothetical protein